MQVNYTQVEKATRALLAHEKQRKEGQGSAPAAKTNKGKGKAELIETTDLLNDDTEVHLIIGFSKIPSFDPLHAIKIPVKHRIFKPEDEICLITKDPQRKYKDLAKERQITPISKVIGLTKLKAKYRPFEAKRLLAKSYQIFLADKAIWHLLPPVLGKEFIRLKNPPIPVKFSSDANFGKDIEKALNAAYLYLGKGSTSTVVVGRTSHSSTQLLENIKAVIQELQQRLPKKGQTVQSLNIKTSRSIALPIYNVVPKVPLKINDVKQKKKAGKQEKEDQGGEEENEEEEEEISK